MKVKKKDRGVYLLEVSISELEHIYVNASKVKDSMLNMDMARVLDPIVRRGLRRF